MEALALYLGALTGISVFSTVVLVGLPWILKGPIRLRITTR